MTPTGAGAMRRFDLPVGRDTRKTRPRDFVERPEDLVGRREDLFARLQEVLVGA
jgi:hypothetical protein